MTRYSEKTGLPQTYQVGPFSNAHLYLQWGGSLPGGEQWSCGLRLIEKGAGPWAVNGTPEMMTAVVAAVRAFHVNATTCISTLAKLSFVKLNTIDINGHYDGPGTNETVLADVGGGSSAAQPPNQVALAISLLTGFSRGPAHRGRFYMPLPVTPLDSTTGGIYPTNRSGIKTNAETLLTSLNAASDAWEVGVMSRKAGAPGARRVTAIAVGLVMDTQRRRRRSIPESYT